MYGTVRLAADEQLFRAQSDAERRWLQEQHGIAPEMEQRVKGPASGWGAASRPGAADGPRQRRWIRLILAGRDGMTRNRRELPRSSVAGHRMVPHRTSRFYVWSGASAARGREGLWSAASEWLLGRDRPDEAGVARAGDDDLLWWFAAAGHPLPALVEALLTAPGALDDDGVLAALAASEFVADGRPAARVLGRLDQQPAACAFPTLVIEPCRRCSPEERSEGTRPTNAINSSALRKRPKSPISLTDCAALFA